jgi:hypothetical protein
MPSRGVTFYLFIYLFSDTDSSLDYTLSNDRIINEQ